MLCDYGGTVVCPAGSYKQPVGYASQPLPPAESACATSKPEWDCTRSAGEEFQRSTNCTMGSEVVVSGDLTVTGKETVYSTLTAASGKRHFKITIGAPRVSLSWLNLTGGNVGGSNDGGSIYVYNVAAHLNISHCVFFNNRAGVGGAIFAADGQPNLFFSFVRFTENKADDSGGAVYLDRAKLVDHSSMYNMNTAGYGGALYLSSGSHSSFFNSSLVSNTAGERGGGIYIDGGSFSSSSFLNMSSVTLQSNKQIGGLTHGSYGGGGLYLAYKVTANIRECTFIRNEATEGSTGNKQGHQIFTYKSGSDIPSIAIVNTNFTDVSGSHPFYGYDSSSGTHGADKYVTFTELHLPIVAALRHRQAAGHQLDAARVLRGHQPVLAQRDLAPTALPAPAQPMQHKHHRSRTQTKLVQPPGVGQAVLLAVDKELDQARVQVSHLPRERLVM